ncbi:MAG: hypothetical protein ASARMPREDX12_000248 [Alectoria sarmentosa]|nr:MAG: hypothetical protein ASARMPREDX12_000248 [Alectoria sarmentosa]
MSSKPTIVFVPGAFHTPKHFIPITELLQKSSYPSVTVSLPSIGAQAATATLTDDIQAIRSVLEKLIEEEGKDVVVAAHSYGGVPACQTVTGLEKSERANGGKKGGVIHVLFIAALLVEEGKALADALGGGLPPWAEAEGTVLRPVNISAIFYSDLSAQDADHWTSLLLPQSAIPSTMPSPAQHGISVTLDAVPYKHHRHASKPAKMTKHVKDAFKHRRGVIAERSEEGEEDFGFDAEVGVPTYMVGGRKQLVKRQANDEFKS